MTKDNVTKETAQQLAISYLKKKKNTEKISVAEVEQHQKDWIIRGTCPIDMEGHPWIERFEVIVDPKGKIKSTDVALL